MPRPKNPYKPFKPFVFFDEDGNEHLVDHPIMQPPPSVRKNRGWVKEEAQRVRVMEILHRISEDRRQNKAHYLKKAGAFIVHAQINWSDILNVEADDRRLYRLFKCIKTFSAHR